MRRLYRSLIACWFAACSSVDDAGPRSQPRAASAERRHDASASAERERDAQPSAELDEDAGSELPAPRPPAGGCPVHVSLTTFSYGTGNHDDDDYAPNNVGAVWITDAEHAFVRTLAVWGPNYWSFAETWVRQSDGSRVDIVAGATRKNHAEAVEADWDCRDKNGALVEAGTYRVNVEFAETEGQGPLLTRDSALAFELGAAPLGAAREPGNSFGPIAVRVSEP